MEYLDQIGAFFLANQSSIAWFARFTSVMAIISASLLGAFIVLLMPIRIRFGIFRLDGLLKLIGALLVLGWMCAAVWAVIWFPFVVIAKLTIIHITVIGGIVCWVLLLSGSQIDRAMTSIQQECELANKLTFLQAEMARAQLQTLNDRIQKSIEPEEREMTETMLKSISPLVSMFLRRERSVIKWSVAAVDVGKELMRYFFNETK